MLIPSEPQCSFCSYLSGIRPYTILARTAHIAVLVTREQRGIAHVLVIPIAHVPSIIELNDLQASELGKGVRNMARVIQEVHRPEGIAIWQNNGTPAHQTIGHVHFHIAATLPGGGTEWGKVPELSVAQIDEIAHRLRDSTEFRKCF